jgi:hypothetical protein
MMVISPSLGELTLSCSEERGSTCSKEEEEEEEEEGEERF